MTPRTIQTVLAVLGMLACAEAGRAAVDRDLGSSLANTLTHIGDSVPQLVAGGLTILGNERQERAGRQAGDAMLVTAAATLALKDVFGQSRPNEPGADDGFPSAHASSAFAFARAIAEEYDDWGKLAYLFAGGVGWSRVRRNDHTISQVVVGGCSAGTSPIARSTRPAGC